MTILDLEFAGNAHYERGCKNKVQCQTEDEAKRSARHMKHIFKKAFDPYRCRFCGFWHCGTRRKKQAA